ncbi:hypothetical protein JKP88DRAFT_346749 [Tribonema minus]|uniref:AP2/ERF domain-containing protein n=1 Tax=Tribonema minus TaxID=303371 RepID=A0A835Z1U3_9STRA|nr:hypothetical protein JKP88DRAFT_346749 [Tribonema minus]
MSRLQRMLDDALLALEDEPDAPMPQAVAEGGEADGDGHHVNAPLDATAESSSESDAESSSDEGASKGSAARRFQGVYRRYKKFEARHYISKYNLYLGSYDSALEAALAYNYAMRILYSDEELENVPLNELSEADAAKYAESQALREEHISALVAKFKTANRRSSGGGRKSAPGVSPIQRAGGGGGSGRKKTPGASPAKRAVKSSEPLAARVKRRRNATRARESSAKRARTQSPAAAAAAAAAAEAAGASSVSAGTRQALRASSTGSDARKRSGSSERGGGDAQGARARARAAAPGSSRMEAAVAAPLPPWQLANTPPPLLMMKPLPAPAVPRVTTPAAAALRVATRSAALPVAAATAAPHAAAPAAPPVAALAAPAAAASSGAGMAELDSVSAAAALRLSRQAERARAQLSLLNHVKTLDVSVDVKLEMISLITSGGQAHAV